jgi:hypothetical protein
MNYLLSHWHCILPIAVIGIGMLVVNRGQAKGPGGGDSCCHRDRPEDIG